MPFDKKPQRLAQLASAVFTRMDQARRQAIARGADVINLFIGSPDLPPAAHVVAGVAVVPGSGFGALARQ